VKQKEKGERKGGTQKKGDRISHPECPKKRQPQKEKRKYIGYAQLAHINPAY